MENWDDGQGLLDKSQMVDFCDLVIFRLNLEILNDYQNLSSQRL